MRKAQLFIFIISVLFANCNDPGECGTEDLPMGMRPHPVDPRLLDSVLIYYVTYTDNKLVRLSSRGDTTTSAWHLSNTVRADTATYYVYSVGHERPDKNSNKKFVAVTLLYVDTLTFKSYEYDESKKALVEWETCENHSQEPAVPG